MFIQTEPPDECGNDDYGPAYLIGLIAAGLCAALMTSAIWAVVLWLIMKSKTYEMSEADFATILNSCKPVPYLVFGGREPSTPQENANRAWAWLGERMGFQPMTVRPLPGKGGRLFTAVPIEKGKG